MGWERDYLLHGRPFETGYNPAIEAYEYGKDDEEQGISFADSLRRLGAPIKEGVDINTISVSYGDLEVRGMLEGDPVEPAPEGIPTIDYLRSISKGIDRKPMPPVA